MKPSILVISSFPPKGQTHNKKIVGIASYTKNLLSSLSGHKIVLAEKLPGETNCTEGETEVRRIWKRDSFSTFFRLFMSMRKFKEKTILFEFEHAMFGEALSLIPLPFFLFFVNKILDKKVFFVFHQVIGNIDELAGHLNLKRRSLKSYILNLLIPIFYKLTLMNVTKAVVFEEDLKKRLGNSEKIEVIPHGVEIFVNKLNVGQARKQLGLPNDKFILLCFGFLAWYKGSDLIVDIFAHLPKKIRQNFSLILAGGPNPNHIGKSFYNKYINKVKESAKRNGVLVTGFVPEEEIPLYFEASDLILLPYRTFMSASGPMSLALSFEKPFLISPALNAMTKTKDFAWAMRQSGISEKDLIFRRSETNLENMLKAFQVGNLKQNLIKFNKVLRNERYFEKIAVNYERILFQGSSENVSKPYPSLKPELA